MSESLESRVASVRERVNRALLAAGRAPESLLILAVTKSVDANVPASLAALGLHDFGENRLEGLTEKARALAEEGIPARWHFIGQIQRNKLRRILAVADVLHSVDRIALLESVARSAAELGRRPAIYLQVSFDDDPERAGFEPAEVARAVERARAPEIAEHVALRGLMTLAPQPTGDEARDTAATRAAFEGLAALARELPADAFEHGRPELSMGMSDDLELAVEAGSDLLRIGRALVGAPAPPAARGRRGGAA